jgi:thiamine kinase-like enzyme
VDASSYRIEYIRGYSATQITSVQDFERLVKLVEYWGCQPAVITADWFSYLVRLQDHVAVSGSEVMELAWKVVARYELPGSFAHGDLTLENVLVEDSGEMVLIDPNYAPDLFQSWLLDFGKLLQSTHSDYHRLFNSSPGEDPAPLLQHLRSYLQDRNLWELALVAELSHVIRLRKYRPESERWIVDKILSNLVQEIQEFS